MPKLVTPAEIEAAIRNVPDFPKPGIQFKDITPVLADARLFAGAIELLTQNFQPGSVDAVVGIDARGFIIGSALAYALNVGFVPVRKKGKLPYRTVSMDYALEYGNSSVELHEDAVRPGQRVLLVDDLVATGGTMLAAISLLQQLGSNLIEAAAIVDLPDLGGSEAIMATGTPFYSLCEFEGD